MKKINRLIILLVIIIIWIITNYILSYANTKSFSYRGDEYYKEKINIENKKVETDSIPLFKQIPHTFLFIPICVSLILISIIAIFLMINLRSKIKIRQDIEKDIENTKEKYFNIIYELVERLEEFEDDKNIQSSDKRHTKRVGLYCEFLAKEYGLSKEESLEYKKYAKLHDIGKIGVDDRILRKITEINNEEYELIKKHVEIGYNLIKELKLGDVANNIVKYHHERWDGKGYLNGLEGEEIPLEARIISLAEVYDALRMKKIYKPEYSHDDAVQIILEGRGKQFEPKLVDIFIKNNEIFALIFSKNI